MEVDAAYVDEATSCLMFTTLCLSHEVEALRRLTY
jgi:hypothetical protein